MVILVLNTFFQQFRLCNVFISCLHDCRKIYIVYFKLFNKSDEKYTGLKWILKDLLKSLQRDYSWDSQNLGEKHLRLNGFKSSLKSMFSSGLRPFLNIIFVCLIIFLWIKMISKKMCRIFLCIGPKKYVFYVSRITYYYVLKITVILGLLHVKQQIMNYYL